MTARTRSQRNSRPTSFFNRLSELLDRDGDINLVVLEFHLKCENDLSHADHKGRTIRHCGDPEKYGINSSHYAL